jgi:hypothetical protein
MLVVVLLIVHNLYQQVPDWSIDFFHMETLDGLLLHQETSDEFVRQLMLSVVRLTGAANKVPSSAGLKPNITSNVLSH